GQHTLTELNREFKYLVDTLQLSLILTHENSTFVANRVNKILGLVTRLKNRLEEVIDEITNYETISSGERHGLSKGIEGLWRFMAKIEHDGEKKYNWEKVIRKLEELKEGADNLLKSKPGFERVCQRLDEARQSLIKYKEEFL